MTAVDVTSTRNRTQTQRSGLSPAMWEYLQVYVPLIAIIVGLSLVTNMRNPAFLSSMNVERVLVASAVLGILAIGQTLLLVGGQFDLSVGSVVSFTSVIAAKQVIDTGSDLMALVVCLAVGALIGLCWGVMVATLGVPPFILTLGGLALFSSLATALADSTPIPVPDGLHWWQTGGMLGLRAPIAVWLLCLILASVLLHYTRFGRNLYALGSNEEAAFLSGVPVNRIKVTVFVLNGLLTGLAGIVIAGRVGAGDPRAGVGLELIAIAAIVLGGASLAGGRGSILGSTLGVLVLGVVSSSMTFLDVPDTYNQFVFGAILIAAVSLTAIADLRRKRRKHRRL